MNMYLIKFYTLKPLPQDLRGTFQLPEDPFNEDPAKAQRGIDYLDALGVFHYADIDVGKARGDDPNDTIKPIIMNDPDTFDFEPFPAYQYQCLLGEDDLKITQWPEPTGRTENEMILRGREDKSNWRVWARPITVTAMRGNTVTFSDRVEEENE